VLRATVVKSACIICINTRGIVEPGALIKARQHHFKTVIFSFKYLSSQFFNFATVDGVAIVDHGFQHTFEDVVVGEGCMHEDPN
jgi:hypothetical protein